MPIVACGRAGTPGTAGLRTGSYDAAMDATLARKMWRTLEPYHGMIYFSPHAAEAYRALGVVGQRGYFASRSAPMGAVTGEVVVATFFNFDPALVHQAFPSAWEAAPPSTWIEARLGAVDTSLREVLGDDVVESAEVAEAAELARRATEGCSSPGRPLYAGHASLAWPTEPHLVLWHAITLLREFRGDGHIAALVDEGLDGCEALVTHGADGSVPASILQSTRGWSDEAWAAASSRLAARGWLDGDTATAAGVAARQRIEDRTDELAMGPWRVLGADDADSLRRLVRPLSKAISESGVFLRRPDRAD